MVVNPLSGVGARDLLADAALARGGDSEVSHAHPKDTAVGGAELSVPSGAESSDSFAGDSRMQDGSTGAELLQAVHYGPEALDRGGQALTPAQFEQLSANGPVLLGAAARPVMAGAAAVATADDWLGWEAGKALGDIGTRARTLLGNATEGFGPRALTGLRVFALNPIAAGVMSAIWSPGLNENEFSERPADPGARHFEQGPQLPLITATPIDQPGFHIGKESVPIHESDRREHVLTHPMQDPANWNCPTPFPADGLFDFNATTAFPADPLTDWSDSIFLSETPGSDWPRVSWDKLGALLGEGGEKRVFGFGPDRAIGLSLRPGYSEGVERELDNLNRLSEHGVRAVSAQPVWVGDDPSYAGLIYGKRYEIGSKDLSADDPIDSIRYLPSPHFNETSLEDLFEIRQSLYDNNILLMDFQVLVDREGHVDVADPFSVIDRPFVETADPLFDLVPYWDNTESRLDGLIDAALRSIRLYPR